MAGVARRFDRCGRWVAAAAVAVGVLALAVSTTATADASPADITFAPHVDYPTGDDPEAVATGDLNGDGVPDVIVAVRYQQPLSVWCCPTSARA